jgi:anti-sigma factor RsiW
MTCKETQELIHGYVDHELDLVRNVEIEEHLQYCLPCGDAYDSLKALGRAVGSQSQYFKAPAGLQRRILAGIRAEAKKQNRSARFSWRIPAIASGAAILALTLIVAFVLVSRAPNDSLAKDVLASHIRSMMEERHLVDVASSDRHTVKPWFNGKLDFAPPVQDLLSEGYPLIGGRLDYLDGRPVAALVYGSDKHMINLFIWPKPGAAERGETSLAQQGYNMIHWSQSGMTFWAVSDVNATSLSDFVRLLKAKSL